MAKMEVKEALEKLQLTLATFKDSDDYKSWLKNQARFHRYSPRNMALILWQKPDATHVAGFTAWKRMGRAVLKGETGIEILSPVPFKKDNGKSGVFFKMSAVFDISQTEAVKENAFTPDDVRFVAAGETDLYEAVKAAALSDVIPSIQEVESLGRAMGTHERGTHNLQIVKTNSAAMACIALHEWAHARVQPDGKVYTYQQEEVIVESIAFTVAQVLGIQSESETSSFRYITGWMKDDEKLFVKALGVIQQEAKAMVALIEKGGA